MKYQFTVDHIDTETTHGKVLNHIQPGSCVLECGCATGYITKFMKEKLNCKVHIVEYEQQAFDIASDYAEGGVCADLTTDTWTSVFEGMQFDYILFMDVLEHLLNPAKTLKQAVALLKPEGSVLISLPNIAHNDVLINLHRNVFNYSDVGLLDNTHIHFFGKNNLDAFLRSVGLEMVQLEKMYVKTGTTELFWTEECRIPQGLLSVLSEREDGEVYQFVVTAKKAEYCQAMGLKPAAEVERDLNKSAGDGILDVYRQYVETLKQLEERSCALISAEEHARMQERKIQDAAVRYEECSKQFMNITQRYTDCYADLKSAEEKYDSCCAELQKLSQQNAVLQEQLQQTQQAIESRAEMAEELQKISQCNKDLSAQMCRTSEKHRICSKKLEQAEIQISEAEERIKEISRQHESCQERLRASEIMVQKLGIKYSQLELVYNQIVMSRGWRFLNKYYAVRDAIFPKNSAIREFLKKIAQALFGKNAHSAQAQLPPAVQTSTPGAVPVRTIDGFDLIQHCKRIDILSVPHTAYIAKLLQSILLSAGLECQTHLSEPEQYEEIPYIMVCPQNFKRFPTVYIAFQMEQTINSRWLTEEYMDILHNAYAVFDYSLENIKYFNKDPLLASKMYYLPVDVCEDMMDDGYASEEKEYDVLFYGAPFVEHRQRYLKPIGEEFNLRIICEQFGPELYREMNKAKILINVHYYEDALLETTRLYETLSVSDCLIISERSGDPREEAALEGIVDFVEVGDVAAMMERIRYWLDHEEERKAAVVKNRATLEARANAAKFFLYRFLLANDRITFDNFYNSVGGYIHFNTDRICLSLPESTTRAAAFAEDNVYGFEFFPGLKHRMGWIGCGMSYKFMLRKAMEQKMEKILICEDDVYFPPDFQKRFDHVLKYAEENNDWNVFSGIMADIGRVKPLKYAQDEGEEFIYLDKMISMVFNLYDKSMFEAISAWDNMNRDVQKNTIDRYLEDKKLRILATCPFLVGHKEDLHSTIWGQQNTIYTELIANSSMKLQKLVEDFKKTL